MDVTDFCFIHPFQLLQDTNDLLRTLIVFVEDYLVYILVCILNIRHTELQEATIFFNLHPFFWPFINNVTRKIKR